VTLTTRVSLFFLSTLGLVLAGFSVTLYLLAGAYLRGQAAERLQAALNTLNAAAEVGPADIEWELNQRHLNLGPAILWLVNDDHGGLVDQSGEDAVALLTEPVAGPRPAKRLDRQGASWLVQQKVLVPDGTTSPHHGPDDGKKYPSLRIAASVPLGPMEATLHRLGWVLLGLSLGIWLLVFLAGRFLCRRALFPLTHMAESARTMDAVTADGRLPPAGTGDELDELGQAFNSLLDRLRESFERQRRFTGDASHQLRTPLTAILGQIEVALRRERPATEYQRVLATVRDRAEHLHRIVEALLFLARADSEAPLPDRRQLELSQWLSELVRSQEDVPRAADLLVDSSGPAWVVVPPVLLEELVNLLLDNARKYSDPGTPITLGLRQEGEFVELSVRDRGAGIAPDDLPLVFTPFFRSDDARRQGVEGLGLGLSIAQRLAHACGATLTATSTVGEGSCFTVRLARIV
jgi:signal transduction histidine kinase